MISDSEHNLYQHLHTQQQRIPINISIITSMVGIYRVTTFPAIITSVALLIPSTNDSLHPYKLSNFVYRKKTLYDTEWIDKLLYLMSIT